MAHATDTILVIDDDPGLRDLLGDYLRREGFEVACVENGTAMHAWRETGRADLIILDLMLPGEDGLSLARGIRRDSDVPIIMLSARGEDVDRIIGLEVGADDYLAKPFNPRELLARIRAVLRRRQEWPGKSADASSSGVSFGRFRLDLAAHRLYCDDEEVTLTGNELELLKIFAERPNQILDRDQLLDLLKGFERAPFDRSIDVQVARLRAKIEPDTKKPRYIRTVWGRGYVFTPED